MLLIGNADTKANILYNMLHDAIGKEGQCWKPLNIRLPTQEVSYIALLHFSHI